MARHGLSEKHHAYGCDQRRDIEGPGQQVGAKHIRGPVLLKVIKVHGYMVDACPHECSVAADENELDQAAHKLCRSTILYHFQLHSKN